MAATPKRTKAAGKFLAVLMILSLLLMALSPLAAVGAAPSFASRPGTEVVLYASDVNADTYVAPSTDVLPASAQTATISVNYTGFSDEARAAFQRAVDIWQGQLTSGVIITVDASYEALPEGVLGSAGPTTFFSNWDDSDGAVPAPRADIWYPAALANKLAGVDFTPAATGNPNGADITARFSSAFPNWYFGTDGQTPADTYDFVSVVLHELGHGLGFVGAGQYQNGTGSVRIGGGQFPGPFPVIYSTFVENGGGASILGFPDPSTELGGQLTSNDLYMDSPTINSVLGGTNRARIYAPPTWTQGSSYSHWDDVYEPGDPNSLMTPQLGTAEGIHNPGPLTRALFQDMGWSLEVPTAVTVDGVSATPATNYAGLLGGAALLAGLGALAAWRRKQR